MSGLADVLKQIPASIGGRPCITCGNAGWAKAVSDYLDGMIDGSIPADTGQRVLWIALTEHFGELDPPVDQYPGALTTISGHIRRCERERWKKVEALRAGRGAI